MRGIRSSAHIAIAITPATPFFSSRLQLHHVMRRGFALAGGADADEARLLAQLREVGRAEIAHAGLDAADQLRQHAVHRAADFLQRLDAFRRDLARRVGRVAVARGRALFHRRQAAHAAVLLVELAADLHHLARRFRAAGKNPAANDRLRQRQRLDDVAGLGDAAVGEDGDAASSAPPATQT